MTEETLDQFNLTTSNFGFSAASIDSLGASEYTLVTIACDVSGSVGTFKAEMEKCLASIVTACRHSPRADNLLLRLLTFGSTLDEVHGFKQLMDCNQDDYNDCLTINGMTALVDASVNSIEALNTFGKKLTEEDYNCNGILIVITDGCDNHSTNTVAQAGKVLADLRQQEALESLVSILVGVNTSHSQVSQELTRLKTEVGFDQYVELDNASTSTLAKLAQFVSKSISAQSQALGTGGPSQALTF